MSDQTSPPRISSFAPIADANTRILILGSMPGEASLAANQYYGHPRNQFWPIMGSLYGARPDLPYDQRLAALTHANIALWDSLQSCIRSGSLDSAIEQEIPNDFTSFLHAHPLITHIFFNGAKAEHSFRRSVLSRLARPDLVLTRLPSTSPAHAGMPFADKLENWRMALNGILRP